MTVTDDKTHSTEDDEMLDDTGTEDETDDEADEETEPEPFVKEDGKPFTKADFDALQEVVKKARKEARDAKKTRAGSTTTDSGTDGTKPEDAARIALDAETKATATWKPLVIRGQASAALTAAGLIGKPDRLLKLLDYDDIDVDPETGELDGLDEQIADLKRDYGQLFRRKGSRQIDAADRGTGRRTAKMTDSEIQAAQLRGEI